MNDEEEEEVSHPQAPPRDTLVALRFEKGMTRDDIADHYKVSIATVRRWIKDMKVPRPSRRKKPLKLKNLTNSGEIVADIGDGYTRFEHARILLEGRVIERTGYGYYLDGRPSSADAIIAAAGT